MNNELNNNNDDQVSNNGVVNSVVTNETNQTAVSPPLEAKYCSVCGKPLDVKGECSYCKLTAMAEEYQKEYQEGEKKETSASAIVLLVLSVVNLLIVFPFVSKFAVIWLLFGAFSGDANQYYWVLALCCGYMGSSIIGLIGFIVNLVKKGRFLKGAIIIAIVGFALGLSVPYVVPVVVPLIEKASIEEMKIEEGAIIYQDENYIIKQKQITKSSRDITLTIELEKLNPDAEQLVFSRYISINYLNLMRNYSAEAETNSDEITFVIKTVSSGEIPIGEISTCNIFFYYGTNYNLVAKFKIDGKEIDREKRMSDHGYKIALENDYFKVYYKPNSNDYNINLYVEGKSDVKNRIIINKVDADTPGYETMMSTDFIPLYEHNTEHLSLSYYPCEDNMSYLKIYYSIYDENNKKIEDSQIAEKYFDRPQYIGNCDS